MNYMEKYKEWLESPVFDEETKKELRMLKGNDKEIEDRFYTELEFGTAGLRGIIGAGTNRMNIYIVRKATQGLANFLNRQTLTDPKVAIAYDSRNFSDVFAKEAALVLAANGVHTYLFDVLKPVPELSFAVRHLKCDAGIVITASHNPSEYNGYKVYGNDGAQVIEPYDQMIIEEVNAINDFKLIKTIHEQSAIEKGLLSIIGEEIDRAYLACVKEQVLNPDLIKQVADDFKIVYTPIHGTGNRPVRAILEEVGFKNVYVVEEQEQPDGNFPTVVGPNPENKEVFALAIKLAQEVKADIIMGTDPDADRLGVLVPDHEGEYFLLTGNMLGAMLTEYILSQKSIKGKLEPSSVVIKTIVTTEMVRPICKAYDVEVIEVLTGFKYIGEQIRNFEAKKDKHYVFGFEESYGCLAGTYARDKDAVVASMLAAEMAAYYKTKGMTLYEGLISLYNKYGYYKEDVQSITLKGIEGLSKIREIMEKLREEGLSAIGDYTVLESRDYEKGVGTLPKANVLYYKLTNQAWLCIRPSGTEPKIKFYIGVRGSSEENAVKEVEVIKDAVNVLIVPWLK